MVLEQKYMNDESYLSGVGKKMGDVSLGSEGLHVDSDINGGLGFERDLVSRVGDAKMDEVEKKSGSKIRAKPIKVIDDDEPIGSMFKLKRPRNPKKVKPGLEDGGKVEVGAESPKVNDEDSGEMETTLACFRKKLKGPKVGKNGRSGKGKGEDNASNGVRLCTKEVQEGPICGGDGLDSHLEEGVADKQKSRRKRSRHDAELKKGKHSESKEGSDKRAGVRRTKGASMVDQKRDAVGCNHSSDENFDSSLSEFIRKSQPGSAKRARPSSNKKQGGATPASGVLIQEVPEMEEGGLHHEIAGTLVDPLSAQQEIVNPARSNNGSIQVCNHTQDDSLTVPIEAVVLTRETKEEVVSVGKDGYCEPSDGISGESFPRSSSVPKDSCYTSIQRLRDERQNFKNGLKHCSKVEDVKMSKNENALLNKFSVKIAEDILSSIVSTCGEIKPKSEGVTAKAADIPTRTVDAGLNDVLSRHLISLPCGNDDHMGGSLCKEDTQGCDHCLNQPSEVTFKELRSDKLSSGSCKDHGDEAAGYDEFLQPADGGSRNFELQLLCSPESRTKNETGINLDALYQNPGIGMDRSTGTMDKKLLAIQRAARKIKKRRHGDMAYEGDVDWEFLIHEQGTFESDRFSNGDRPSNSKDKFEYTFNTAVDSDNGGAAAVAAGLKARAAGPVEKIKFKEVLKRRGGLQEYLECRNFILGLWSKDMCRILPLVECGVTDAPSEEELPRSTLIREIYEFLDHRGYINVGVASEEKKADYDAKIDYEILKEKRCENDIEVPFVNSDYGANLILGRVTSPEKLAEANNAVFLGAEKLMPEAKESNKLLVRSGSELSTLIESEHCEADIYEENNSFDANIPNDLIDKMAVGAVPSDGESGGRSHAVLAPEHVKDSSAVTFPVKDPLEGDYNVHGELRGRKKVIVVGAGPAGLIAARHLQRQGFSVTVLEARNRLGGRVYTDRSSLSVPVDLGASIITGVEADVATERRPDPSSLICSQLGLDLTILNSDCPLYDIVTGQKVQQELDETLEAEYNSLLDDTIVLVAQEGDRAMKMSLEDGLEYALKRRRGAQFISDTEDLLDTFTNASSPDGANGLDKKVQVKTESRVEILSPLERRVMDWHFANLEYGCAALLKEVSLPYWNQDDVYGGFGGAHCMIKGGYGNVVESLGKGIHVHLNHVVTEISYGLKNSGEAGELQSKVKISTSNGNEFLGDAVLITVPLGCLKADSIKFSPALPEWKCSSIQRLGFGVLNKVVLEFPEVFWDDSVDYFGATAEETVQRGRCFMFWNVRKTVGAPVLIALVVGKAAVDGQDMSSSDHVDHALRVLRKLFGEDSVPDPVGSVVTNWGNDPFSRGAYSYVAVGASGEDYDILGRPVDNCLFFAGEATCKEHPDTVGGAMMSGLREAVRIIDIFNTGNDYTAEVEAMEAAQRQSDSERNEVRDILKRLDSVELSNVLCKSSFDGNQMLTKEALLRDMFYSAKTTAGRLHLAKKLLNLPVEVLKSFAGTKEGLVTLNKWILDSMGKDGTQLLRHCVRLLVLVSTNLLAVRLSGIGRTVKEKVCVHTSRDIRAVASQLVNVWIEVFRKEKASNGGMKLLRQTTASDSSKAKSSKDLTTGKLLRLPHGAPYNRGSLQIPMSPGNDSPSNASTKKTNTKLVKLDTGVDTKSEVNSLRSLGVAQSLDSKVEDNIVAMTEEEKAAFADAEAARAAALAAAEAYASSEAGGGNILRELPKIPSFHKFARREQYAQMDEFDARKRWSGGVLGRQDCMSEIDSRNCRVRDWSVDFSAACANLDSSRMSGDNYTHHSFSNEVGHQGNMKEHSGESAATDRYTKAWVDSAGSGGVKDYLDIERWQSQAEAAGSDFFHPSMHIRDEEDSNTTSNVLMRKHEKRAEESSVSQAAGNMSVENLSRGAERIKKAIVDYVGSLLMPLYKARKIDKEGYKSIMKKSATKVMEQTTDAEKCMSTSEFLDFKRKNKIRSFVDKLIEKHMAMNPVVKP